MGGCVTSNNDRKKQLQTCYYMAPEELLRLPYDKSSDMWALGCAIYEIMTGKILFDPDGYDGNEDRYHLYLISQCIGQMPEQMINASRYKDILFTVDAKRIKGFTEFESRNIKIEIQNNIKYKITELEIKKFDELCEFINSCIQYQQRITVEDALKLRLFTI